MRVPPWFVPDGLWLRIERLLPKRSRRFRYPGRLEEPCALTLRSL